jgi:Tfp pilus assembly protein PilN
MIEINLLPGARRSKKSKGGGVDFKALLQDFQGRIKDPYMAGTVVSVLLAIGSAGWLYTSQSSREEELTAAQAKALADSTRYSAVIAELKKSTSQRDSVLKQFKVIRAIDGYRYVWAHLLDEVSRHLPDYTWVTAVKQSAPFTTAGAAASPPPVDPSKKKVANDTIIVPMPPLKFHVNGVTVDIQALTRYMRDLEGSPFIKNVTLVSSQLEVLEGRDVTRFELDAEYEVPPSSAVATTPLSIRVK